MELVVWEVFGEIFSCVEGFFRSIFDEEVSWLLNRRKNTPPDARPEHHPCNRDETRWVIPAILEKELNERTKNDTRPRPSKIPDWDWESNIFSRREGNDKTTAFIHQAEPVRIEQAGDLTYNHYLFNLMSNGLYGVHDDTSTAQYIDYHFTSCQDNRIPSLYDGERGSGICRLFRAREDFDEV
jgi:hypothetical protein